MQSFVKVIVSLIFFLFFVITDISEAQVDSSISVCYPHDNNAASCTAHTCPAEKCAVYMATGIELDKYGLPRFTSDGAVLGEAYYFCNVDFHILCSGQFCGIAMWGGNFSPEMVQFLSHAPPCGRCDLVVSASPSEVWPQKTGNDDKTTATIMVTATNPPPEGCTVNFKVEPVENSGGHSHDGDRLKGTVIPASITIPAGSSEPVYALYSSSDVSGQEKIIFEVNGSKADEKMIEVKVIGLFDLGVGGSYRLTGSTGTHPANHYGTDSAIVSTNYMANDFYEQFSATLGINDMSLEWGGLFDICGTWRSSGACFNAPNGGHNLHRKGTSVDIDRCAQSTTIDNPNSQGTCPNGWIQVNRAIIERICNNRGGELVPEGTIHCEISQ